MALESRGGCYKLCDWEHHDSEAIGCARHRVGCADTLPALPRADGHYRDQDEVLRRVLRVQGLPRGACGPPNCLVAGEGVGAKGDTLRSLRGGVEHTAVHGVQILLPELRREFQSWVQKTLSFLFWRGRNYKRPMRTRIGPQQGRRLGEKSAERKICQISDLFVAAKAATHKDYQRVDWTLPKPATPA
jgi:hypothetical protein